MTASGPADPSVPLAAQPPAAPAAPPRQGRARRAASRWRLIWRLLRAEGPGGVAGRLRDRRAEARRRRAFRPAAALPPGFACTVLNLAAAAPSPRLGGVQAQLLRRLAEEAEQRPVALLYPDAATAGGGFRLEVRQGQERWALRLPSQPAAAVSGAPVREAGSGGEPRPYTLLSDPDLERAVAWATELCGAKAIVVEGLAGTPLTSLLRLRRGGLRLILAVHDFALFCPRPHLLERLPPPAPPRFCHYSRDAARCARCLGLDFAGLPPNYQGERREQAEQLLACADAIVYPSVFLAGAHRDLFAGADAAAARIIAPAAAAPPQPPPPAAPPRSSRVAPPSRPAAAPEARAPRHIAWVGAVQPHKGALVFEAAVRALGAASRHPRLTAYGGGDPEILLRWRRLPGLRVSGYYRSGTLPALLRRDRVDLALLLSVVPESYGLTLDECAAAGVPVVAFDLGAVAGRIAAAGSGLLLAASLADDPPEAAGAALAALLGDLLDGRLPMPPPAGDPLAPHQRHGAATAAAWMALYRDLALPVPPAAASEFRGLEPPVQIR